MFFRNDDMYALTVYIIDIKKNNFKQLLHIITAYRKFLPQLLSAKNII